MTRKDEYDRRNADKHAAVEKKLSETWRSRLRDPMNLFTCVLAIATVFLTGIAGLQWHTLEKTDDTLKRTLEITQRPWIDVSAQIAGPLKWDEQGFSIPFKVVAKNTGYAPANNIFIAIRPFTIQKQPFYMSEILRENCDTKSATGKNSFGKVIFREGTDTTFNISSVSNAEFDGQIAPVWVILCAAYISSVNHAAGRSVVLYQLARQDPTRPGASFTIERKDGDVPPERLRLHDPSSYAD